MGKVFVDIGAHIGESIEIALKRKYRFDRLIAVEPSSYGLKFLKSYRSSRLEVFAIGVSNRNCYEILYGAGSVGGSLYADKTAHWDFTEYVEIRKFSSWITDVISVEDEIWLKVNIEGGELEIVEELQLLREFNIKSLLISFDVEKVPSRSDKRAYLEQLLSRMEINYMERKTDRDLENWLDWGCASTHLNWLEKLQDFCRFDIPVWRNARRLGKSILPSHLWFFLAHRLGPNRKRIGRSLRAL